MSTTVDAQAERIAILEMWLAQAEEAARQAYVEKISPAIIRRALDACDRCSGLPTMSINRCAVCRILQEGVA